MNFKTVMDIFGHIIGPLQVMQVARALNGSSDALDRVILWQFGGENGVSPALAKSYGAGISINDQLDREMEAKDEEAA